MSNHEDSIDSIESSDNMVKDLYGFCGLPVSNGWATLTIQMSDMSEEDRKKVYQAESLLREVGVSFDGGSGFGGRDWELDYSLDGAILRVSEVNCHKCRKKPLFGWLPVVVWEDRGCTAYCSDECRQAVIEERANDRIVKDESGEPYTVKARKPLTQVNHWYARVTDVRPPEEDNK